MTGPLVNHSTDQLFNPYQLASHSITVNCHMLPNHRIYPCGDHAITIELGTTIDRSVNEQVISLYSYLSSLQSEEILDIIPSYHTLTIIYDLYRLKKTTAEGTVYHRMKQWLAAAAAVYSQVPIPSRQMRIPVCYEPEFALDAAIIAAPHQLSMEELVRLHTACVYRVYLLGFLPGFAYMGTVDEKLVAPRKISPRTMVPAGSVGIAGAQTGIYPFDSPGGWQIIGRTPLVLFNRQDAQPCLLQPGDEVSFYAIDTSTYHHIQEHGHTHS